MKNLSFFLSLIVALIGAACQTRVQEREGIVFRVTKIERRAEANRTEADYLHDVLWITCVTVEPKRFAGMDFRFGCEKMPNQCTFHVGGVFRANSANFVVFDDWSRRYEAIHVFKDGADEVSEIGGESRERSLER